MRKILLLLCVLLNSIAYSQDERILDVTLSEDERLFNLYSEDYLKTIHELKISGSLDYKELEKICNTLCIYKRNTSGSCDVPSSSLKILDLYDVTITGGDGHPLGNKCIPSLKKGLFTHTSIEKLRLPANIYIDRECINNNPDLKDVEINTSTIIGYYNFSDCAFKTLTLLDDTEVEFANHGFQGAKFEKFIVGKNNNFYSSYDGALTSKSGSILYKVPEAKFSYTTSNLVTDVEDNAFQLNSNIRLIVFGENVKNIEEDCIYNNEMLNSIICLSKTPPIVEKSNVYSPFFGCHNLKKLYVLNDCVAKYKAAYAWSTIENIIGFDISELEKLKQEILNSKIANYDFMIDGIYYKVTDFFHLECGVCNGDYDYSGKIIIPDHVNYNGRNLAVTSIISMTSSDITDVILPSSLKEIGNGAFEGSGLKELVIPEGVTTIGASAFRNSHIIHITIPQSVVSIGDGAFSYCKSLESVHIPEAVSKIPRKAFFNCHSLKHFVWNPTKNQASIYETAFGECNSLTKIVLPSNVDGTVYYSPSIGEEGAFFNCTSLDTLILNDNKKPIYFNYYYRSTYVKSDNEPEFYNCPIRVLYVGRDYKPHYYTNDPVPKFTPLELTIGDSVASLSTWPTLYKVESLTIGTGLNKVPKVSSENLRKVYVRSTIPQSADGFSDKAYFNATLYVPIGSKERYANAPIWKNFWNIQEYDAITGIQQINTDNKTPHVVRTYTLEGICTDTPVRGINIIKYSNGRTKKILTK